MHITQQTGAFTCSQTSLEACMKRKPNIFWCESTFLDLWGLVHILSNMSDSASVQGLANELMTRFTFDNSLFSFFSQGCCKSAPCGIISFWNRACQSMSCE